MGWVADRAGSTSVMMLIIMVVFGLVRQDGLYEDKIYFYLRAKAEPDGSCTRR
jgi:hypothetical protein